MSAPAAAAGPRRRPLDRFLGLFAEVRAGEGPTALLLMLNVFLLLCCYYLIRPVREALVLGQEGAEVRSYASAAMAATLVFLVPAYGALASRVNRMRLITRVSVIFASNLVAFYLLGLAKVPHLGVAFFIWVGIFNMMIVAQFWSFANDVYTPDEGKRLFPLVVFGANLGAIVGASLSKPLIGAVGVYPPLLVAAAVLALSLLITGAVNSIERRAVDERSRVAAQEPLRPDGGFKLVLADRYLAYLALLAVVLNFVNTNGEFILAKTLTTAADTLVASGQTGGVPAAEFKGKFIGQYYAGFLTWVNTITALVQLFVVSRVLKRFGVRVALFVLPLIALGGYTLMAMAPIIGIIRTVKIMENSTDLSLQNTARQALYLPTSREAKYKAKAAIDTFFVRMGDVLSGVTVALVTWLALTPGSVTLVNLALVLVWILIVIGIGRRHRALTAAQGAGDG